MMDAMETVTVLAVGGTGESCAQDERTDVTGLLRGVVDGLGAGFTSRWVGYPASYGPVATGGLSFHDSADIGASRLLAALAATTGPVALIGYSQGCTVIRKVLGLIATGVVSLPNVIAAGLISDPQQPRLVVEGCNGSGVAGDGPPLPAALAVRWIGHPADMICNASDDSLVRDIADLTRFMSLRYTRLWLACVWKLLRENSFQNSDKTRFSPAQWIKDARRLRTAAVEIAGYLPKILILAGIRIRNSRGGKHVAYSTEPLDADGLTGCQVLAEWLQSNPLRQAA